MKEPDGHAQGTGAREGDAGAEKFVGYFRLVDACALTGCPVCRCVDEAGRRYLDAIMYEQVNDPDTRLRLHASWGFCNWHTWMLPEIGNSASGAAVVYEDVIRLVLRRAHRFRDRAWSSRPVSWIGRILGSAPRSALGRLYRRRKACPVCAWSAEAEAGYVRTTLRFIDDPQFARAYAASEGLCVPHMLDAVERGAGTRGLAQLLDRTLAKWEELRKDLDNTEPFTEAEASSYRRAYEMLAGRRGIYGNDLHGALGSNTAPPAPRAAAGHGEAPRETDEGFERRKLELRVRELTEQFSQASSRAAALHYRLSRVAEDRNALELNLSGERGANALAMGTIADLRAENERLRAELETARGVPLAGPRREA